MRTGDEMKQIKTLILILFFASACSSRHNSVSEKGAGTLGLPALDSELDKVQPELITYDLVKEKVFARTGCFNCHSDKIQKHELNLKDLDHMLADSALLKPEHPEQSELFNMVDKGEMPPSGYRKLTKSERNFIFNWILAGAKN